MLLICAVGVRNNDSPSKHHVFTALCGGRIRLASAKPSVYAAAEGGSGSINCHLSKSGSKKFFCKGECKVEEILIKTDGASAQSGRYSIQYKDQSSARGILSVAISNMTESDEGRYRCGLGESLVPDSYSSFEVRVLHGKCLHDICSVFSTFSDCIDHKIQQMK